MGRKQDPIFRVVDFFETEPIAVVRSALSLVKRIVQKREAADVAVPKKKVVRRKKKLAPVAGSAVAPSAALKPDAADIALGATTTTLRNQAGAVVTGREEVPGPATDVPAAKPRRRRVAAEPPVTAGTTGSTGVPNPSKDLALPGLGPSTVGE